MGSFASKQIVPRVVCVIELPRIAGSFTFCVARTTTGIAATALSLLTAGLIEDFNEMTFSSRASSLLRPFFHYPISVINPDFDTKPEDRMAEIGICTEYYVKPLFSLGVQQAEEEGFFQKHIVSRTYFALGAIEALIARLADAILAVFAVIFSFLTLGRIQEVNNFAMKQLSFPGIIDDIGIGLRGVVNPEQFIDQRMLY